MCTKSPTRIGLAALLAASWIATASAEKVQTAANTADDAAIDRALGALRPPVLQLVLGGERGAPIWPLYKQEIAKGQTDFRPAPVVESPARRERRSTQRTLPQPPTPQPPPPQPQPCTPNSPNWPNCLQQP